jgi:hypothetical protein
MIENPQYKNILWNPLVQYSLGETESGGPVAILGCTGEDGEEVTLCIPDKEYLAGLIKLLTHAVVDMSMMELNGFEAAAEIADNRTLEQSSPTPDDLSGLEPPSIPDDLSGFEWDNKDDNNDDGESK